MFFSFPEKFRFYENSVFLVKMCVCVCVCVCVCAHVLYILGRENLSKRAGFDQEFSAVCLPYFINSWETVIRFYPHLHLRGAGVVRKSESPWEAGPPVKRTLGLPLSSFSLLPLPSWILWESLIHRNEFTAFLGGSPPKALFFSAKLLKNIERLGSWHYIPC